MKAGSGSAAAGSKGKQVKVLYELVTVSGECEAMMSLSDWEGGLTCGYASQETCLRHKAWECPTGHE
jgi:hypothetical protein